jgi:hypothetical protein
VFTRALHSSLFSSRSNQSIPSPILILSSHPRLGLHIGLFPSGFPTNILYATLFALIRVTCPAHLILLTWCTNYAVFSNLLSLHLSSVQIYSSTPCS